MMGMPRGGAMSMDCSKYQALCQQSIQDGARDMDSACESMGMSCEERLAMHDRMAIRMMPTPCH